MTILTVGYLHGYGGAERQLVLLSNQLAECGHNVTLCVLNENKAPYRVNEQVKVIDLSPKEGTGRLRIWRRFRAFKKVVKSIQPDIIINYNLQSAYFCLGISREVRGKVVYSERGDPYDNEYSGLLRRVRDLTVARMDGLVFQSECARDFFPEKVRKKSVIIHNSVNVSREKYPIPNIREKRIVNVGRLHPQKNQHLLIDAFAKIAGEISDYMLEIYGDGPLRHELQLQIEELGLEKRITIYPSRNDIWDCIYCASIFVLTSDYEGMPNALMEAMALGIPCVSTDCRPGGARTLIENGVNGILTPCRDENELASSIKKVLYNKELSNTLAQNARKVVLCHNNEVIFKRWNDYLKKICIK